MRTPIATNNLVLGSILTRHARYRGEEFAVVFGANRLSYSAFNGYVNRWANALQSLGVRRGDRVATVLPNTLELLATYWSCAKLGAAAVPLSPLLLEGMDWHPSSAMPSPASSLRLRLCDRWKRKRSND